MGSGLQGGVMLFSSHLLVWPRSLPQSSTRLLWHDLCSIPVKMLDLWWAPHSGVFDMVTSNIPLLWNTESWPVYLTVSLYDSVTLSINSVFIMFQAWSNWPNVAANQSKILKFICLCFLGFFTSETWEVYMKTFICERDLSLSGCGKASWFYF